MRVIRPFVFVREKDLSSFAKSAPLPIIPENCPACFAEPKVWWMDGWMDRWIDGWMDGWTNEWFDG